jgi:MoxR-like ATPase
VSETFLEHVVELVGRTRVHPAIDLGGSPRAGIALIKAARARALIHGRGYVVPEDLFALAEDVFLHRMRLRYEALADGLTAAAVLEEILAAMGGGYEAAEEGAPGTSPGTARAVGRDVGRDADNALTNGGAR